MSIWVVLLSISLSYQLFAGLEAILFLLTKSDLPMPEQLSFCQVKPVKEPNETVLEHVESFLEHSIARPHPVYLCSAKPGPRDWLASRPQVTWQQLTASQEKNGKAATLALGQEDWLGDIIIVSDADMVCQPEYLQQVLTPFQDPSVGVVTCLYRGALGDKPSLAAIFESLSMLDFASSVLVARRTEGLSFALGSTMAIRREVLEAIGGFKSLSHFLADDYQLGHQAYRKGWKIELASTILATELDQPSLRGALLHQLRWLITTRICRPLGHLAFLLTQGVLWATLASVLTFQSPLPLFLWWGARTILGAVQSYCLSFSRRKMHWFELIWLLPKDFAFLGLWAASLFCSEVSWGDRWLRIDRSGKIVDSRTR